MSRHRRGVRNPLIRASLNRNNRFIGQILPFSPTAFYDASRGVWQDSARTTPAAANADVVGAWEDLSGNGYHAIQGTTANKPTLRLNVLSSLPVIRFDGNDFLRKTSFADFSDNYTAFVILKMAAGDNSQGVFEVSNGTFDTGFYMLHNVGNSSEWRGKGSVPVQLVSFTSPDIKDSVFRLHSMHNTGTQLQYWLNNVSKGTATYTPSNANTLNQLDIGKINTGGYDLNAGDIATLILFNRTLTTNERNGVVNAMNSRYGVY